MIRSILSIAVTLTLSVSAHAHDNRAIAGAVIGAVVGYELMRERLVPPPVVYYPPPVHRPSPVPRWDYNPYTACDTARVPVYDQWGRLIEYRQYCR